MRPNSWNDQIKLHPHDRLFKIMLEPAIPHWLRPNHVTIARMALIPFVLYFLYRQNYSIGVPLFLLAALTDAIDGSLARVRRQITEWGIVYDPLADKLLIGSVLFVIVLNYINYYLGMALLVVEGSIIVGSWYRRSKGIVQPAEMWGKSKMVAEVVGIVLLLLALWLRVDILVDLSIGTLAIALVAALVSIWSRIR